MGYAIKEDCTRKDLIQERSMNEQWGVLDNGDLDTSDFRGDGGSSEFSNYACQNCGEPFDSIEDAIKHLDKETSAK